MIPGASLWALVAYALISALVAALRHPGDAPGAGPALLRFLGALSCLRFRDAPGAALSLPFLPQAAPGPEVPTVAMLVAMGQEARAALRDPTTTDDRAWAKAMLAGEMERQRLVLLMRDRPLVAPNATDADPQRPPKVIVADEDSRELRPSRPPPMPGAGIALLVALGLTAWACSSAPAPRRNAAREAWVSASKAHLAAWQDLQHLDLEVQQALTLPPRTKARALADLTAWRARRQHAVALARAAQDQAERAADELALRSPPERQEQAAREAAESARALAAEVRDLRAFAAQLTAPEVPGLGAAVDGGGR